MLQLRAKAVWAIEDKIYEFIRPGSHLIIFRPVCCKMQRVREVEETILARKFRECLGSHKGVELLSFLVQKMPVLVQVRN